MKDLLSYLLQSLVDKPEAVWVEETEENGTTYLSFGVSPQDAGKVIGKGGKIIKALRNVVKILAVKEGKKVNIELVEESKPHSPLPDIER